MNTNSPFFLDEILFVVLPYIALVIFLLVSIRRYLTQSFTFSSLSSQFLENQQHFWGLVPFHYGIIAIVTGHLIGFLIPREVLWWNSYPLRLYVLEISAFIFGVLTLVGLTSIIIRRLTTPKIKMVSSTADWILFGIFIVQIVSGLSVAVFHSWGSSWFASSAVPYLWSLATLSPDISYITAMPWMVKLHIVCAYVMIAFFPFTRLVHALVVPNPYLWRKTQVVRWYGAWKLKRAS
ncbi:MAG: respiratory nitrate reductase subunit gamma [Ignavibacteriales bacterium]|nr:respiratory nitrate reductase subunit gamma [Ignavibacteriales bacterium]